jgi:hypothetical protein
VICDLEELQHVHGRALTLTERAAIEAAIAAAKKKQRDPTAAAILERAFGRPNGNALNRSDPHLFWWAMRYVALQASGRDPAKNPARRQACPAGALRRQCRECEKFLSVRAFRLKAYGYSAECLKCKP